MSSCLSPGLGDLWQQGGIPKRRPGRSFSLETDHLKQQTLEGGTLMGERSP